MKKIFIKILFLSFVIAACVPTVRYNLEDIKKSLKPIDREIRNTLNKSLSKENVSNSELEAEAKKWLGTPYKWGGNSRRGIDCSAFVQNVYDNIGVKLPRTANQQYEKSVIVKNRKAGDLIFFKKNGKNSRGNVTHVGIYLGNGEIIHASSKKGVIIQNIENSYLAKRYFAVGRVL